MANLMKLMAHLTPSENKAWLQIYTKIYDFCQAKHSRQPLGVLVNFLRLV